MSHIVSFNIEGLAGREKPLEVELNRDTNIFFGHNGSGKTSLLKILHAAMSNSTDILNAIPFKAAEVNIYSLSFDKVFTRSIEKKKSGAKHHLKKLSSKRNVLSSDSEMIIVKEKLNRTGMTWSCNPKDPKEALTTSWIHRYLPTSRIHVSDEMDYLSQDNSGYSRPWITEEHLDSYFAKSVENLWSRYSAEILGAVRSAQEQGLASILRAVLAPQNANQKCNTSILTSNAAYDLVKSFLERQSSATILGKRSDFEKRYSTDQTLQNVVKDIDSVEAKIRTAMTSRDMLQKLITRMFTANKEIRFADESIQVKSLSGEDIGLASLSSGEKHLLKILVESLLVGESSLMVDEPEISMHVDWQKDLISSLRALNPQTQLIFATHSPEIMADIPDDKIFRI